MAREWDVRQVASVDRSDAAHSIIANMTGRVNITFASRTEVQASGVTSQLGALTVATVHSNAKTVERTVRLFADEMEPGIFLGLQVRGSCTVVQRDRQQAVRPGDLVIFDSSAPYTVADEAGIKQHFLRIPLARLALTHDMIAASSSVRLAPGDPISELTSRHLRRLAAGHATFEGRGADAVAQPSIDLLRAVITTHAGQRKPREERLHETLLWRVMEHLRNELGDPGLSASSVAAHHHISVRHLYKVLAAGDVSLADWIRTHRLEACRTDLSRPSAQADTIESIARRWGFTDMSSFSRAFRRSYGMTPREWRRLHAHGLF
ncbi:helix-turn-helix domain-containing protein [Actinacidiphila rubida]|uniref:AraC-type DNA-binding protein n=1 Tax=Actinacidiphila rubida TaxID=310780 RepID=A0A1H8QNL2_9ACTN|nr:helix-turn-helix domain-containing protein [Actinacidiphila rubida]SEO55636.1 AraC-type DNA-binding protein [Actinacidiphila rubida]